MSENEVGNGSLISKVDYILQIQLQELKSEKEAATSYSIRYREVVNSFERKIFASAAAVITLLTATLVYNALPRSVVYVSLFIALLFVIIVELLLSQHQKKTAALWFELDQEYMSSIAYVNKQRVILAVEHSRIDWVEIGDDQLHLLISYTAVSLGQCRLRIIHAICKTFENICLGYIEGTLFHLLQGQNKLLNKACETYRSNAEKLEKLEEVLSPDLPLDGISLDLNVEAYKDRLNSSTLNGIKKSSSILWKHFWPGRVVEYKC